VDNDEEMPHSTSSFVQNDPQPDSRPFVPEQVNISDEETQAQGGVQVRFSNI
jgi:hypothetical protein